MTFEIHKTRTDPRKSKNITSNVQHTEFSTEQIPYFVQMEPKKEHWV